MINNTLLCVAPHKTLLEVVTLMSCGETERPSSAQESHNPSLIPMRKSSYALVVEESKILGIITEQDIVKWTAQNIDFEKILAQEIMTKEVKTLYQSEIQDHFKILSFFRDNNIRHIPILNAQDKLIGVVSQEDVYKELKSVDLLKCRRVEEVMSYQAITAPRNLTVLQVTKRMQTHRVSCIVIVEKNDSKNIIAPIGIISERDIVQFQALGLNLSELEAHVVMSTPLVCHRDTDDLWQVHQTMEKMHVRRLVITSPDNRLLGLITQKMILSTLNPVEMQNTILILQKELQKLESEKMLSLEQRNSELEQQLQISSDPFRAIFNQTFQFIGLLNIEGTLLEANQTALAFGGLKRTDVIGYPFWDTPWWQISPQTQHQLKQAIQDAAKGNFVRYNVEVQGKDNEIIAIDFSLRPICDSEGNVQYIIPEGRNITDLQNALEALRKSEQKFSKLSKELEFRVAQRTAELQKLKDRYRLIYKKTPVMLHSIDQDGYIRHVSDYWLKYLGYERDEVIGHKSVNFLTHDSQIYAQQVVLPEYFRTGQCSDIPYQIVKKNGETIDVLLSATKHEDASGVELSLAVMVDVTASNQELFKEKELAQVTLHSIGDAVITTDANGVINYFNPVAEKLTGWQESEAKGLPLTQVFKIINEITRGPAENPVSRVLKNGIITGLANHTILVNKYGVEFSIEDSAAPIRSREGEMIGAVMVFHDVTQSRQLSRELSWQANHDNLTRLPNRLYFEQTLKNRLQEIQQENYRDPLHALLYLDLDQFKVVNDTCGHGAGDELLKQISRALQDQIRAIDILARLGGDEFGILLRNCSLESAKEIAENIRASVENFRFNWNNYTFSIGVSIGVVIINQNSHSLGEILSAADSACYAAKNHGRNRIHIYQANDTEVANQRGERQWSIRIRQALEENRFQLYEQLIANTQIDSGNEIHYEILLRMVDKTGKLVLPGDFIPAAERYDLMTNIDQWVVTSFFKRLNRFHLSYPQENHHRIYFLNISGCSIGDPQFLTFIKQELEQYKFPGHMIGFEITETAAILNLEQASKFIKELKALGCQFALDDFGTGMSSFGYLKNLAVDYLKIDGAFIKDIIDDPATHAIVESINHIGHVMGLKTIAEFVENNCLHKELSNINVDFVQGFGISRPSPLGLS